MELVSYLPTRLQGTEIGLFQEAVQPTMTALAEAQAECTLQLVPETATWGLDYWEQALGLNAAIGKTTEVRRSRVAAALRGATTSTVAALTSVAQAYAEGEVEVLEYPGDYRIEIKFITQMGIPAGAEDMDTAVGNMIPAHLSYAFVYRYRTHGDLRAYTNAQLHGHSHLTLKSGEITV